MTDIHNASVLVVEDDASLNDIICKQISKLGLNAEPVFSGSEAKRVLEQTTFDLIITDLMLPGMTGEDVVSFIRSTDDPVPIIVISARSETSDKVDLLSIGADDYITKPFDLEELSARILVQLRNSSKRAASSQGACDEYAASTIQIGGMCIVPSQRSLTVNGNEVSLTRTEFDLLQLLAENPKRVFTKQELYEHIWDEQPANDDNSINTHISNIRTKLKPYGADKCIHTVWGIGFKIQEPEG